MRRSILAIVCAIACVPLLAAAGPGSAADGPLTVTYIARSVPVQGNGPRHVSSARRPYRPAGSTAVGRTPGMGGSGVWEELASVPGVVVDLSFPSPTVGFAAAELGRVWKTTDGGETWVEVLNLGFPYYWYGVHALSENDVIVSGFNNTDFSGIARWTHDGGATWSEDIVLTDEAWSYRVRFADASTGLVLDGLAVPQEGTYAHFTTSGGESEEDWGSVVAEPEGGWFAQQFSLLTNGKARAAGIKYCESADAGAGWSCQPSIDNVFDGGVFFLEDDLHGWVGGGSIAPEVAGWVHRTSDGGATWSTERDLEAAWPIRALLFVSPDVGWAVGGNHFSDVGGIYATEDGGESWVLELDSGYETAACARAGSRVLCSGFNLVGNGFESVFFAREAGAGGMLEFGLPALEFGDVEVGTTSPPQTATLSNTGDTDVTAMVFSGLPDAGFEADTGACGDTLPAGGSCAVSVTFTPAAPGPATATLHVEGAEGAMADLELSGNGIGGGGGPIADITPESFSFEVPAGGSDSDTLNVGNVGDADLTWSIAEAAAPVVSDGAPYRHGLAETPAFNAPVGHDRASGISHSGGEPPATPVVLPAPQGAAIGDFTEGFDDLTTLPGAGWAMINNSDPAGPSSWFQGNETIFPAHAGDPDAYIAANYESTDGVGTISNWLLTPEVTIVNGTTLTFWTRKSELFEQFADRMEVRMSIEGASTDVGDTADLVGDFVTLLLEINPDLVPGEYPQEWTSFTVTVRERSRQPVTGRFAFRYFVTDSGPEGTNGDYIGIDTVSVTQPGEGVGCTSPTDIPWLSTNPISGTTPPADTVPVTVSVDTTDLEVGGYVARLCVTTNDPAAPLVAVPVSLTVGGAAAVPAPGTHSRWAGRASGAR